LTKAAFREYSFRHFPRHSDEAPTATPVTQDAPLRHALHQLSQGAALSSEAAAEAFAVVMRGEATAVQTAALLMGLRAKGETAEEVAGAARALRGAMVRLEVDDVDGLVDTCGTGGGRVGTLNISTAAAFIVAGAGVRVAKHGNRSYTSRSGSADVLEALGIDIQLTPARASEVLRRTGIAFLFAPTYHPAMRHAGPVRKELAVPTIMNLLGPLANPAGVRRQVVGVSSEDRAPLVAEALARLGATHALVLHAVVGMDEVSPAGSTRIWEVREGRVATWAISPDALGLACDDLDGLAGGEPAENAGRVERLLGGGGTMVERCAVLLNAAAALYVAGRGWTMAEAAARARVALESGGGARALAELRRAAPDPSLRAG
jgi:anthranilate phosphoribosyltransferase